MSDLQLTFLRQWGYKVFKGHYKGVIPAAIKVVHVQAMSDQQLKAIMNEVYVLRACRHPHILEVVSSSSIHEPLSLPCACVSIALDA